MLNNIVRLRNSKFTKCKFQKLNLKNNPLPAYDEKEGYGKNILFKFRPPIPKEDSNDNNVVISGYGKPIIFNTRIYNKKLHNTHKLYYENIIINKANVFDMGLYCVDFNNSIFYNTCFDNTKFHFTNFTNMTITNVIFLDNKFDITKFKDCLILNSKFNGSRFDHNGPIDEYCVFSNTVFKNITFNNVTFNRTIQDNCRFIDCKFDMVSFFDCQINIKTAFINCIFSNVKIDMGLQKEPIKFSELCKDCLFENVKGHDKY